MKVPYINTTNKGILIHDQASLTTKVRMARSKHALALVGLRCLGWCFRAEECSRLMDDDDLIADS